MIFVQILCLSFFKVSQSSVKIITGWTRNQIISNIDEGFFCLLHFADGSLTNIISTLVIPQSFLSLLFKCIANLWGD